MLDLEENKRFLIELNNKLSDIKETMQIESSIEKISELEKLTLEENFWEDAQNSSKIFAELNTLKKKINNFNNLKSELENLIDLNDFLLQEKDDELEKELDINTEKIKQDFENIETNILLSDKYDINNAILTIHPGAGGTESQDWAEMLYRMYTRWGAANNYSIKELDYLDGEEAGLKSVTFSITGENAYGYLKSENGVHRLVRISPFDSGGRRHTSFASVEVLPEIENDTEIEINPDDLRIDVYRSSGAGGQHINKTSSAIRIVHLPTNIVVSCQSERSQFQNRDTAMKMLKSKLIALKEKEEQEKMAKIKGQEMDIGWGSQIRSYVFCPYTLVKDHRTNYETGNVQAVMDGNINEFMKEYLKLISTKK